MKFSKSHLVSVLFLILIIFSFHCEAWARPPMPRKLKQQQKEYIEDQISPRNLKFIKDLKRALRSQIEMNKTAREVFALIPSKETVKKKILNHINKMTLKALNSTFGGDPVKGGVEIAAAFFQTASPYISLIYDMVKFTLDVAEMRESLEAAANLSTSYANYYITTNNYKRKNNMYPYEVLKYAQENYEDKIALYDKYSTDELIAELKESFLGSGGFSSSDSKHYQSRLNSFRFDYTSNFSGSGDWLGKIAHTVGKVIEQQLKINLEFSKEVEANLARIPAPELPKMPNFMAYSIEVIAPEGKTKKNLRIGDEVSIVAKVKNTGQFTTEPCLVSLKACIRDSKCGKKSMDKRIPGLAPGKIYSVEWKYELDRVDRYFSFIVNSDKKTWESNTYDNEKKIHYPLKSLPDLTIEITGVPGTIRVNEEADIKVKIKNTGNQADYNSKVSFIANGRTIEAKSVGVGKEFRRGSEKEFTFKWIPDKKGPYGLLCRVERETKNKKEIDTKNNEAYVKVNVILQEFAWQIKKDSLYIMPKKPKLGEDVNIYFTVANKGSIANGAKVDVFIDDEKIKSMLLNIGSESKQKVGLYPNHITWKARGGSHNVKVMLEESKTFGLAEAQKAFSVNTLMPGVSGIDLVLDKKNVNYKSGKITAKVYNRGNKTARGVSVYFTEHRSRSQKPESTLSRTIKEIKPHELKTVTLDKYLKNCKMTIEVDKNNIIKEVNENNNRAEFTKGSFLPYKPPRNIRSEAADLIVSDVVNLGRPLVLDENRQISISVANLNLVDARNVKVNYEFINLALGDITPGHGYLKGHKRFSSVPKEAAVDFIIDYKGVYPADYRLTIWVDPDFKIQETNEYNNIVEKYFTVEGELTGKIFFEGKDVDLSLDKEELTVSNFQPQTGEMVDFSINVHNNSKMDVWGADLDMFVNEELVDGQALGTLPSESVKEITFKYAFDKTGDYKVKLMVDSKKAVPEKNENNNTVTADIKVKPGIFGTGHRDVAITSFSLSKNSCVQGELITAQATIKNVGKDSLRGVLCTIGPSGRKPVYVKIQPILDSGREIKISTTLPTLFSGKHTIEARVDGKNIFDETNEENNIKSAILNVEPLTKEKVKEKVKEKATNVVIEKAGEALEAIDNWLRNFGKPKK